VSKQKIESGLVRRQQSGKAVRRCGDYAACGIATKLVGREVRYSRFCAEFLDDVPGKLLGDPVPPRLASAAHATENPFTVDSRSLGPRAELAIDPVWNRHGPDVTALAAEINDRPMSLALPEVDRRRGEKSRLQMHAVANDHRLVE